MSLNFQRGQSPFIIAEIAQTHDGNVNFAHAFIDAVAKTGANAIKFQTHIAAEESTPAEKWRVEFSRQDLSRYDYWQRMEFTMDQWTELKKHADEADLVFLSSPFSIAAIELLESINVPAWKIGSGEVLSERMLDKMAETKKPIIMSTGMSHLNEIDGFVQQLVNRKINHALMQCTTAYPTSMEQVGLNMIGEFQKRYDCAIGLSDHSGTIWPSVAAISMGASLIEVHVTMSKCMFGPDVSSSVTMNELTQIMEAANAIHTMHQNPIDKTCLTPHLEKMRKLFMKSIVARKDIKAGTELNLENITEKKPGTGIPGHHIKKFIGKTLTQNIKRDEQLTEDHFS